jgi:hypothetical protein
MFPLGTVLVPRGLLPLHIFEPRYRVLMFDCMRGDREFGVVLIERGSEVGGADQRFSVATVARIGETVELPDGRWFLLAAGTTRVDVVEWLPDDPYPRALVAERLEQAWPSGTEADATLGAAERAVRQTVELVARLAGESPPGFELSSDPARAAWELVALAPLGSLDKQRLLAVDDHVERLRVLAALADESTVLFTYRLDGE